MGKHPSSPTSLGGTANLRALAARNAEAAETSLPEHKQVMLDSFRVITDFASSMERKAKEKTVEPAIALLPYNATASEMQSKQFRQAVRRGDDVYLPSWAPDVRALPNHFLRTALFTCSSSVQAAFDNELPGSATHLAAEKEIASFKNICMTSSGYGLCQFDRLVYSTCLDYYRLLPLSSEKSDQYISTSFYEFSRRMGGTYGDKTHIAIRNSLLRLGSAKICVRTNQINTDLPKLLAVNFENGEIGNDLKGSDLLRIQVPESVAELFGPGAWTTVEIEAVRYNGLKGWLASFYASHSKKQWLPVETLYKLTGYESHFGNFNTSLTKALDKLMEQDTPSRSRIGSYRFSEDGKNLSVVRAKWKNESQQ